MESSRQKEIWEEKGTGRKTDSSQKLSVLFCSVFPDGCRGKATAVLPVQKREADLETVAAEMQKIEGFVLDFKTPEECRSYPELIEYAKQHGYKPGWAYYQAKKKGIVT